jgi:hypothetical protein
MTARTPKWPKVNDLWRFTDQDGVRYYWFVLRLVTKNKQLLVEGLTWVGTDGGVEERGKWEKGKIRYVNRAAWDSREGLTETQLVHRSYT